MTPAGWTPGTGVMICAWVAGAAIARLTGAAAVILLLAATLVGFVFDTVAGWRRARRRIDATLSGPGTATVGERGDLLLSLRGDPRPTVGRRRIQQFTVVLPDGTLVSPTAEVVGGAGTISIPATFESAGIVTTLGLRVEQCGPAGLVWWRRTSFHPIDPIHVAPHGVGPLLEPTVVESSREGGTEASRGSHRGDIDGVRPWRSGDSIGSVHWPSSLRADDLIVHDRVTSSDEHWTVDIGTSPPDPARLRWTLDAGRRLGHAVAVRTADGELHRIVADDDAARWSAIVADRTAPAPGTDARRHPLQFLRNDIRLARPEAAGIDPRARWSVAIAAIASLGMLIGALAMSPWVTPAVACAIVVGAAVSMRVARDGGDRPLVIRVGIVLALLAALAWVAVDAADVDGLLAVLRGPMPDMLMLLVVLHGFEVIDRRTLRVHQAITFVVAAYGAGLRIDGALGWWLAIWGAAFVTSILATGRRPADRLSWTRTTRPTSGREPVRIRSAGSRIAWTVVVATAIVGVLSVVPIPDGPARLGLPALSQNAPTSSTPGGLATPDGSAPSTTPSTDRGSLGETVGYPGFTETLDTSVRGSLGDDVVMRVRSPEPAFWRGQTFTEFDGRTWTVSPEIGPSQPGPRIEVPPSVGDALGSGIESEELVQTYFVEQDLPNVVFAAYRPVEVIFDGTIWTRPDGALRSDVTLTEGSVYTVVSDRVQVTAESLRAQGDLGQFFAGFRDVAGGEDIDPFLQLPATTTQRTIDLAASLRTPGASTYDTILAYQAWLSANTEYDLDAPVPAEGEDAVDDFLFESQRGFCEQIASTLTIMLRSQGVPARLATGYVTGERDRVSGVWKVRASDAHAWVEVWFPQTGWEPFDPTASVPLAGDADAGTVGGDLAAAAAASIVSHRIEVAAAAVVLLGAWVAVRTLAAARHRRRRGRWGLLQDRFLALADA
ncbi:MAG: transglutaminaseTgpA domain-containing protein, partial [Ilumatobacteraceae bacterium]